MFTMLVILRLTYSSLFVKCCMTLSYSFWSFRCINDVMYVSLRESIYLACSGDNSNRKATCLAHSSWFGAIRII